MESGPVAAAEVLAPDEFCREHRCGPRWDRSRRSGSRGRARSAPADERHRRSVRLGRRRHHIAGRAGRRGAQQLGRRRSARHPVGVRIGRTGRTIRSGWPVGCAGRFRSSPHRSCVAARHFTNGSNGSSAARRYWTFAICRARATAGWPTIREFDELRRQFLSSTWANRVPAEIEVPFATRIAGIGLRGRVDAVFADHGRRSDGRRLEDRPPARRRHGGRRWACSWPVTGMAIAELSGVPLAGCGPLSTTSPPAPLWRRSTCWMPTGSANSSRATGGQLGELVAIGD